MGISERKDREKTELRRAILNAAKEVFLEKGYETTSIRNIADRIEYSPTTIYLYFKDKDAVFHEIHREGFALLNQHMNVLQTVSDPFERLKAMGRVYVDFAQKNKELYDLMFNAKAPIKFLEDQDEAWKEGMTAFGGLMHTVQACVDAGYFKFDNVEVASFMIWSTLHGMITLENRDRCTKVISEANCVHAVELGLEAMMSMLDQLAKK